MPKLNRFGIGYAPTEEDLKGLGVEDFDLSGTKSSSAMQMSKFADDEIYEQENSKPRGDHNSGTLR